MKSILLIWIDIYNDAMQPVLVYREGSVVVISNH